MDKIFVTIDNERIELTGKDKDNFIAQRIIDAAYMSQKEAQDAAQATAKAAAQAKLAALGLTTDDLAALGL